MILNNICDKIRNNDHNYQLVLAQLQNHTHILPSQ